MLSAAGRQQTANMVVPLAGTEPHTTGSRHRASSDGCCEGSASRFSCWALRRLQPSLTADARAAAVACLGCVLRAQESKYRDAIRYYQPLIARNTNNLLGVTAIVLANLCVSYIMTSQVRRAALLCGSLRLVLLAAH